MTSARIRNFIMTNDYQPISCATYDLLELACMHH
ncbi:hypothetical protein D6356_23575, partial [Salmonella enterica subsp. enterica serovar Mississippi]|nr:hypothetical protein [Salmonella enterica subsp. enterica serovar Mississippi]